MRTVAHHGHGVYCYPCNRVYQSTDDCEHDLDSKAGVFKTEDGYAAQPSDMGHHGPHWFIELDGMDVCAECEYVKIPVEMVEKPGVSRAGLWG